MIPSQFQKAIATHERFIAEANEAKAAKPHVVEFAVEISPVMAMAIRAGRPATMIRAVQVLLEAPKGWCADQITGGWHMSELAVTCDGSLVYDFRFETAEDATLFKMWWS